MREREHYYIKYSLLLDTPGGKPDVTHGFYMNDFDDPARFHSLDEAQSTARSLRRFCYMAKISGVQIDILKVVDQA